MRAFLVSLLLTGCAAQPTCQEEIEALSGEIQKLVRTVERSCETSADCVLQSVDLSCFQQSPLAIAIAGQDALTEGMRTLEARCQNVQCVAASDSFRSESAECRACVCVMVLR